MVYAIFADHCKASGAFFCKTGAQINFCRQTLNDRAHARSGERIIFEFAPLTNIRGVTMVTWTTHQCHGLTFVTRE